MREKLLKGLKSQKIDESAADGLLAYVELLNKWNKTYNLTAVRDPGEMITLHILDSLTALPYLKGSRILDVGTGAGLPGIPLALVRPDINFTLLDTNGKKTRFVEHAVRQLGLGNVTVVKSRIEEYRPDDESGFDTVISRAFTALDGFADACGRFLSDGGQLTAMKGRLQNEEISCVNEAQWSITSSQVVVPGLEAERHMIVLTPK